MMMNCTQRDFRAVYGSVTDAESSRIKTGEGVSAWDSLTTSSIRKEMVSDYRLGNFLVVKSNLELSVRRTEFLVLVDSDLIGRLMALHVQTIFGGQ